MVSSDEDRILYDNQDDEPAVVRPGSKLVLLVALALVVGFAYLAGDSLSSGPNEAALAAETHEPTATPASGFDASSTNFKACDGARQARPDFSIVVAVAAADGQQVVSRVVQFVVVDSNHDPRRGRDVQAQSLCTLP